MLTGSSRQALVLAATLAVGLAGSTGLAAPRSESTVLELFGKTVCVTSPDEAPPARCDFRFPAAEKRQTAASPGFYGRLLEKLRSSFEQLQARTPRSNVQPSVN